MVNVGSCTSRMLENQVPVSTSDLMNLPTGFLDFPTFKEKFSLGGASTERICEITKSLSQSCYRNSIEGLKLLSAVDDHVIQGLEDFNPIIHELAPLFADKIERGGRVFLVGSGSSGRVALDLAAKCKQAFLGLGCQVQGIIAGGDTALIRAKEGFEDSEKDGEKAMAELNLTPNDIVVLISASGSASFNVGCGHYAANEQTQGYYFYNSSEIPLRTQGLFKRILNFLIPLCVDIGPQAIAGSTRLQGATLAEVCLGSLLERSLSIASKQENTDVPFVEKLIENLKSVQKMIGENLEKINAFAQKEVEIFSDPRSNFRRLMDVSSRGYVTFLASKDSIRETLFDATETSPTFSTNPIRRENESGKKRAEFRAYYVGAESEEEAWKYTLGHENFKFSGEFILSAATEGNNSPNSFKNRPKGKGNLTIGVASLCESGAIADDLKKGLLTAQDEGGEIGLIVTCRGSLSEEQRKELDAMGGLLLVMENVPDDPMGITDTILKKQVLNLISNLSMVLMNKVLGNQMIDVRASNNKLIDRVMRLIKDIWSQFNPALLISDDVLYHYVANVCEQKKDFENKGIYTPSVVKIVLAMLSEKKTPESFQEIVDLLSDRDERIDWIRTNEES